MKKVVGIELFAGCGGLSTGFLDAGLHIAAGFDIDLRAVDAYNYNHSYRGSRGIAADLGELTSDELLRLAGVKAVDIVIGGPPCQPFSIVGKRRGLQDERADLLQQFARFVEELNPKVFLLENVPNLASIAGGEVLGSMLSRLRKAGYCIRHEIVSADDFGVPQRRKRLVVVGVRGASHVSFPAPTHGILDARKVTAKQAIGDLPEAAEFGECGIHNHEPTAHSKSMMTRFGKLLPGKRERGSFHDRLHPDRPGYTLRAGSGNFSPLRPVHYSSDRVITVRESARLQGFSDDFIWPDRIPRLQQYRQVGNAVPPPLAAAFARDIAAQLGWLLDPHSLRGDPSARPPAMVMTDEERIAARRSKTRGASLGKRVRSSSSARLTENRKQSRQGRSPSANRAQSTR
jgi:DNA (cytosine-5)-methyltransferase 1